MSTVTETDAKIRRMIELARGHVEAGGVMAAGVYYRMILKDTSPPLSGVQRVAHGEACVWYARKALAEKKLGTATDWFQQALAADPRAVDYRVEYCVKCLIPMGLYKNARIEAERATRIDPTSTDAWRTLGGVEHVMGNVDASVAAYDKQIELAPDSAVARLDRATIALDTADYDTVEAMCGPLLNGDEHVGDAYHCLAMVAYRKGMQETAIMLYDKAIDRGCFDPALATWNKSLAMHSIGDYKNGWKCHEARGEQKTDQAMALIMRRFTLPIWKGEAPPARLHLHQEMGHGDVICMARYIPYLINSGYDVRVEVMDSLVTLLQRSFPQATVMPKAIDYPGATGIPVFDYHVPMLSLPYLCKTDIDSVPWPGAYLKPNAELARHYFLQILQRATGVRDRREPRRIGLCWSSGIRNDGLWISEYGRRKSMKFRTLLPVVEDNPNNLFISLQVGPERADRCSDRVLDVLPPKPDWDDTAALVSCLDLVITVDTSVAHLAGALGKPVMLMMHTEGSWHWMTERIDSPWYPTVTLYRQNKPHDWTRVINAVTFEMGAIGRTGQLSATA